MGLNSGDLIMLEVAQNDLKFAEQGLFGVSSQTVAEKARATINNLMNLAAGKPATTYIGINSEFDKKIRIEQKAAGNPLFFVDNVEEFIYNTPKAKAAQAQAAQIKAAAAEIGLATTPLITEQSLFGNISLNENTIMKYVLIYLGVITFTTFLSILGGGKK
jgi:hypothetical protein